MREGTKEQTLLSAGELLSVSSLASFSEWSALYR